MNGHYLIDTHIWIWWNCDPDRLSDQVKTVIANARNDIVFSVVSGWEIAMWRWARCTGTARDYMDAHPKTAILIVEVADVSRLGQPVIRSSWGN